MLVCPQMSSFATCRSAAHRPPIGVVLSTKQQQSCQSQRAQSLAFSTSMVGCSNSFAGLALVAQPLLERQSPSGSRSRDVTRMGNSASGGPFSYLVVQARNVIGKKRFNKLRGKAISLHSQVIKDFTMQYLGADSKISQGLIRTAKKNGERLGFLA